MLDGCRALRSRATGPTVWNVDHGPWMTRDRSGTAAHECRVYELYTRSGLAANIGGRIRETRMRSFVTYRD